jgi:nucleoside-diphosphate-sugar epimerase
MKVLLTGANGFVGSHILDALRSRRVPTALLVRPTSDLRFIQDHLPHVEVRRGSVTDLGSLREGLRDITHVLHCAGITKALEVVEFEAVNQGGTANVVTAVNERGGQIQRLVHISSMAAGGPATASGPARETDPPQPVSAYGRSKLAAEREVRDRCRPAFVIVRPPAVYGPRDAEFLRLFRAVQRGWVPVIAGGDQALSLVYAPDLAAAALLCLEHPDATGKTFHVAAREVVTGRQVTEAIARVMGRRVRRLSVPAWSVRLTCLAAGWGARLTRRANLLAHDKHREVLADGWVCDPSRLGRDLGYTCSTTLSDGLAATLVWYREQRWLAAA